MLITANKLKELKACDIGIKWFEKHFPNGATLSELANHKKTPKEFLHWGYEHFSTIASEDDKQAYWKKLDIFCDNPVSIVCSEKVSFSSNINRSKNIESCDYVVTSNYISNSIMVQASEQIKNSSYIFNCANIEDSREVYKSKEVVNSKNICNSENVQNSQSIIAGERITDSFCVLNSSDISQSCFIANANNLKKSLFCAEIEDKELMLFNHQISKTEYENYVAELLSLLGNWQPTLLKEWGEKKRIPNVPFLLEEKDYFKELPTDFFLWVQQLPHYNEEILKKILKTNE